MDKAHTLMTPAAVPLPRWRLGSARLWCAAALIAALGLVPLASALGGQSFYVTLVSRMMVFALAALGLNLVLGYGAMVSFGHAMYIGVGAYAVGILSAHGIGNGWVHLAAALAVGAVLATVIGAVCLRVTGVAFIMITLAFAQMVYFLAVSLKQYGGDDGYGLPARSDFGLGAGLDNDVVLYYVIYGLLMATLFAFHRLVHSRFGMVLRGSKVNERRMRALGFDTPQFKLTAYVISALVCVLAGLLLANLTRFMSPSYLQWSTSGELVLMVVLGGVGTLVGPIVGAVVWLSLEELLSSFQLGLPWGLDGLVRDHWLGVLGFFVIVVTLVLKDGLYGHLVRRDEEGAPR
jgi:branched-chain amino acid transport system permease protein